MNVAVIGAGIVGCCTALELVKRGAEVTLYDGNEPGMACSFGNSGAISPASVTPVAMPGILSSLPRMLIDRNSPLHLSLSYLPKAMPWLWEFVKSTSSKKLSNSITNIASLNSGSVELHRNLTIELGVPELFLPQGHLHLYPDLSSFQKDALSWELRKSYSYPFEVLNREGILSKEPHISEHYQVGVFMSDQATILNPYRYVQAMVGSFIKRQGKFIKTKINSLKPELSKWKIAFDSGASSFDQVVLAAGAWSNELVRPLGLELKLESQRGYHIQFDSYSDLVSRTVVLADRKVFITPMQDGLRVGGTVEIAGLNRVADPRRSEILLRIAESVFPILQECNSKTWMGHRPCRPDSVPLVGQVESHPGLWLSTGHGHLGLTNSVTSAKRLSELMFSDRFKIHSFKL